MQPVLQEKSPSKLKMTTATFESLIDKKNNMEESQFQSFMYKDALDKSVVASMIEGADGKMHRVLSIDVTPKSFLGTRMFAETGDLRDELPNKEPEKPLNIWRILKSVIGQDLSRVSLPVCLNEPLSILQKMCD